MSEETIKPEESTSTHEYREPVKVTIKTLFEAGAHYGHQAERWNPKMLPFIYGERSRVHIINLDLTLKAWERVRKYIVDRVSLGGSVLFVGTKQQARDIIKEEALRSDSYFVSTRWLGGTLTNFGTIKNSIERMKKLEDLLEKSNDPISGVKLNKKERLGISRQLERLDANLGGIRTMKRLPDLVFVTDIMKDDLAVAEARRLHIPIIALVDTNVDPCGIDFPIPSNDDSPKTLRLFSAGVAEAIIEGRKIYEASMVRSDDRNGGPGVEKHRRRSDKTEKETTEKVVQDINA